MATKSVIEKLWEVNPEAEIWWDSSHLVFDNWRTKTIQQASDKKQMTEWIDRMYHKNNKPEDNLCRGVTTNPPLSFNAIKDNPEYWAKWIALCEPFFFSLADSDKTCHHGDGLSPSMSGLSDDIHPAAVFFGGLLCMCRWRLLSRSP